PYVAIAPSRSTGSPAYAGDDGASMTHVDAILARLLALHPKRIDLSLDRMWRILDALGHPERRLPPVIHVAGTNGKGSTVAFMRAMLEAAGKSVHVYTSPHLVPVNERLPPRPPGRRRAGERRRPRPNTRRMRAPERLASDPLFRDRNRGRPAVVFPPSRRRAPARGRSRRAARRHQRDRASARQRDHAGVD